MQNGRLQVRPLPGDLAKAVSDAAAGYEAVAAAKGVALKVDAPPAPLAFDAQRITQVMANLLSNAIKFTPAGGTVSVQVDVGSAEVVVSVRDSGQGLDAADQARLFQPFGRADSQPQGKLTGTGLGLYLSKGIVEQHGGRIWCSSPGLGKGSTFAFALPTRVPQPPGAGFA
jgi:signal transduction histidine kinase